MKCRVISTHDHVQQAPDTFTSRMSAPGGGDKVPPLKPLAHGARKLLVNNAVRVFNLTSR